MKKNNKLAIHIEEESSDSAFAGQETYFAQPLRPLTLPDEDEERAPQEQANPSKVIEFQEFLVEEEAQPPAKNEETSVRASLDATHSYPSVKLSKTRREFLIDIPESKSHRSKGGIDTSSLEKEDYKEPPAPSNKKSIKAKNFVFPPPSQPKHIQKRPEQSSHQIEELLRSFDKERQQFYREKSNFEKELLVKEGQIEMLQKMLTGRIGGDDHSILYHNYQHYESLLLEKDLQINELIEKISQLGKVASLRGEELRQARLQLNRLENVNESLLHQLYLLQQRQANKQTTQKFYELKRQKPTTPTARNWQYDKKEELRSSQLSQLQKRLDSLTNNRVEFQDRRKIKSDLNYTQPSRYKPSYDYKTKF